MEQRGPVSSLTQLPIPPVHSCGKVGSRERGVWVLPPQRYSQENWGSERERHGPWSRSQRERASGSCALTRAAHQGVSDPRNPDRPQAQGGQHKAWETLPVAERSEATRPLFQSCLDLSKSPSILSERAEDTRRARPSAQVSEIEELPAPRTDELAQAPANTGRASNPERVHSARARGPGAWPLLGTPEASEGKDSPKWTDYAPSTSDLRKCLRL